MILAIFSFVGGSLFGCLVCALLVQSKRADRCMGCLARELGVGRKVQP